MTEMLNKEFSRKTFVKAGGGLVVGFSLAGAATANAATIAPSPNSQYPPANQVDSFIEINPDNTANLFTSQVEIGNGRSSAIRKSGCTSKQPPRSLPVC